MSTHEVPESKQLMTLAEVEAVLLFRENVDRLWNLRNQLPNCQLDYYRDIRSDRPFFGWAITLYRKIVRRLLKFLLLPMIEQQNKFNQNVRNFCVVSLRATNSCAQMLWNQYPEFSDIFEPPHE